MSEKLKDIVAFDIIRYANCWEDADILLQGLQAKPGSSILSIASGGDNSLALLVTNPGKVVAIDISQPQLYLTELKKTAIKYLEYDEMLSFLGFTESASRIAFYEKLKFYLSSEAFEFWERNIALIEKGIIHQGKFEKYFQFFVDNVLPWIHSQKRVEQLLASKSGEEQIIFYDKKWNTWRWKLMFKIFFSKFVMGKWGRAPQFMEEVNVNVGNFIFKKAEQHLKAVGSQQNHILRYNLTGNFGNLLPHYLQPKNFTTIKNNIDKLIIREGFAEDAGKEFGKFHSMNLSNIFEYMGKETFTKTAETLVNMVHSGGRIAYWNLMVPRRLSRVFPEKLLYEKGLSEKLTTLDKGFFYNRFIVDSVK